MSFDILHETRVLLLASGPNALHCDICDLNMTSLEQANQHRMGKKHQQNLRKTTGERLGIGEPFRRCILGTPSPYTRYFPVETFITQVVREESEHGNAFDMTKGDIDEARLKQKKLSDLYCKVCNIHVT